MAEIWSREELAEVEAIYLRVSPLLQPEARRVLKETHARFNGRRSEHEARGARFELRMLGRLADDELRELELERPVALGATGCTVDLFLPSRGAGVEFMAAQHLIIPPVQVSADCSERYLQEEHGAAFRHSRNFTEDQAVRLFHAVNRKCGEKNLAMLGFSTWAIVDTNATDWLEHIRVNLTREEHFRQLGEAFTSLASTPGSQDEANHLLESGRVSIGFVNSFRGTAPEHLVVFPRNESERTNSETIATLFGLDLLVA